MTTPSPNGTNGRDDRGRFRKGWKGGPGNPHARRTAQIRSALTNAVTDDDVAKIVRALIDKAKSGDVYAAREVLDRLLGKSHVSMEILHAVEVEPGEALAGVTAILARRPDLAQRVAGVLPREIVAEVLPGDTEKLPEDGG